MTDFLIGIAGRTVAVTPLFESTGYYCRNYLAEAPADFSLAVDRESLPREQERLRQEALEEGLRPRVFPDPFLERSWLQRSIADRLLRYRVLLFHGSTVAVDGKAYLFTAPCGTGKSTHTRLWREVFGSRAVMVNDDKPFLRLDGEQVLACGAPWSGKHGLDSNISVPLAGICILERGREDAIRRATEAETAFLFSQSHRPEDPALQPLAAELTAQLIRQVPVWQMRCTKDASAARVAWEAMHK